MIESLVLIQDTNAEEELRSLSLTNAKQLVLGSVPDMGTVLHVAANSTDDLSNALIQFAKVQGTKAVLTLLVRHR
jgi:hypothetical protein